MPSSSSTAAPNTTSSTATTTPTARTMPSARVIYWFRTDLRLHDSPALAAALALSPAAFFPVWTWDPHYVYRARVGANRWQFLLDCQRDVSSALTRTNKEQKLWVVREAPLTVLPKLVAQWRATHVVWEKDTDAYGRARDKDVRERLEGMGVEVLVVHGRTLYDADELVKANGGRPTMSFTQVQKAAEKLGPPARPLPAPRSVPDPGDMDLSDIDHERPAAEPDFNAEIRQVGVDDTGRQYESIMGPKQDFAVPEIGELGIAEGMVTTQHRGGETRALRMLDELCEDEEYVGTFEKPKSSPAAFEPPSTTLLSPHLHFGSLSVREYWWRVQDVLERRKKAKKHNSGTPVNLPGQLLFRDMYFGAQAALGYNFAQTHGNKVARFVDWHLQSRYSETPLGEHLWDGTYVVDSSEAEEWFQRWKYGRTGFPWIDALMRQLRQEGWIHHLGRHSVACFLTRGGCYVSWERGVEVFEEWLLDHEPACNVGNWMWLSCTAFFSQFYRCYSPIAFAQKWDPEGKLVRKYVPELGAYDKKYIYEPHKAPISDQKKWKCMIGREEQGIATYPKPMFDFNERREVCIAGMKKAYAVGLYGDSKEVMDGSWKKIFAYNEETATKTTDNASKRGRHAAHDDALETSSGKRAKPSANPPKKTQGTLDTLVSRKKTKR